MIISFLWGLFVGAVLGIVIAAILAVSEDDEDGEQ
jgi:hypothetical protein